MIEKETEQKCLDLLKTDIFTCKEIGDMCYVSRSYVQKLARKNGISLSTGRHLKKVRKPKYESKIGAIMEMLARTDPEMSHREIAEACGVSRQVVQRISQKHGYRRNKGRK